MAKYFTHTIYFDDVKLRYIPNGQLDVYLQENPDSRVYEVEVDPSHPLTSGIGLTPDTTYVWVLTSGERYGIGVDPETLTLTLSSADDLTPLAYLLPTDAEFLANQGVGISGALDEKIAAVSGMAPTLDYYENGSTSEATTTSPVYLLVPNTTVTPASGTYEVKYSASCSCSAGGPTITYGIFIGDTVVAHSERSVGVPNQLTDREMGMYSQAIITVDGTEPVAVYCKSTNGTVKINKRNLILIRLA